MKDIQCNHGKEHQHRIEDIHESLVANQVSVVSLRVLNQPKYRANENKCAGNIQPPQDRFPRAMCGRLAFLLAQLCYFRSWLLADTDMEYCRGYDEKGEEEKLNAETGNRDVFASVHRADRTARHDTAACS